MRVLAHGSKEANDLLPKYESKIALIGTGKSKHLPRGHKFFDIEKNAKLFIDNGIAVKEGDPLPELEKEPIKKKEKNSNAGPNGGTK